MELKKYFQTLIGQIEKENYNEIGLIFQLGEGYILST